MAGEQKAKKKEKKQAVKQELPLPALAPLLRAAANDRLPHAILLWGPLPPAEKDAFAATLAFDVLRIRRKIKVDKFRDLALSDAIPDFIVIRNDPERLKEGISVEQIEALNEELPLYPVESENRVVYMPDADLLTLGAQNALLKKLEEPSRENYFILSIHKPRSLLRTILSRCLPVYLASEQKSGEISIENYLPLISNREEAKKLADRIGKLFETNPGYGLSAISETRRILGEASLLSDEERLLVAAYALSPHYPLAASKMIALTLNPQKLSLDALFHYTFNDEDDDNTGGGI